MSSSDPHGTSSRAFSGLDRLRRDAASILDIVVERLGSSRELPGRLGSGCAGALLLCEGLERAGLGERLLEHRDRWTDALVAELDEEHPLALWSGNLGIVWALDSADVVDEESLVAIDEQILEVVNAERWPGLFDLISGLVGIGLYLLGRVDDNREVISGIERVIEHLHAHAVVRPSGLAYASDLHTDPAGILFDTGLAHGAGGVVGLAALAIERNIAVPRATELVTRCIAQLRAEPRAPEDVGRFPALVREDGQARAARLAWCYGDPGMSFMLCGAASAVQETAWREEALEIARVAAQRRDDACVRIHDAGLCHGSAGAAHMFHRWHQQVEEEVFLRACAHWVGETHRLLPKMDAGHIGYLEGLAGVGLAMLEFIAPHTLPWDYPMLTYGFGRAGA